MKRPRILNEMKVLLVNPSSKRYLHESIRTEIRYDPPLAALYLGSYLTEKGIAYDIVDTAFNDIDTEKIRNGEYGLVSFTVFIGEFLKKAKEISNIIKQLNSKVPIVFGGVMASIFPDALLKEYPVDFIIRYEGELTLYELVLYLDGKKKLQDIKGLSYVSENHVIHNPPRYLENDLDTFPVPKWEIFGEYSNEKQIPYYFSIMTSKGCPFKCSFCYNRQVENSILADSPTWRFRSADHVIAEIERIHALTNTRVYTIGDDNFLVNRERAIKILNYFKQKKFYIEQCQGHMNNFNNEEVIEAIGGIVQTAMYSIESASPKLLKLLNKNIQIEKAPQINHKLFQKGITTAHNFIVGLPTETDSDLKMNVQLMIELKKINPYVRAELNIFLALPFTPLESYIIQEMGFELPHDLNNFEQARFDHFEHAKKFRPWLDDERYNFLNDYCNVFRDAFKINNMELSENSKRMLDENQKLKHIFIGIERINKPSIFYMPYVLDRVLKGKSINLERDLTEKVNGCN